jgi:uncharacterized protein
MLNMDFKKVNQGFVLKFDNKDSFKDVFTEFLEQQKITSGFFYGLGALSKAEISYYSLGDKEYHTKKYSGEFEVLNLTGNIALVDNNPFVHAHCTLGNTKYNAFGGHLMQATVSPTLEIFLQVFDDSMKRKFDSDLGLKLLHF